MDACIRAAIVSRTVLTIGLLVLLIAQPTPSECCWNRLPLCQRSRYSPFPRPLVPIFSPVAIEEAGWPKMVGSDLHCSKPALVDIDGDGMLEVILGSTSNPGPYMSIFHDGLWAFRPNGRLVEGWPAVLEDSGCASPAVGDLNGDGKPEIIMGSSTANLSTDRHAYGFDNWGTPLPGWPLTTTEGEKRYVFAAPSLGDLDGDGLPEVIYGSRNGLLYACKMDGSPMPGWPVDLKITPVDGVGASPALGDIDNDGSLDVIVYLSEGFLYALNADGTRKEGWPRQIGSPMSWGWPPWIDEDHYFAEITCAPTVCDLDGDRNLEIIFLANTNRATVYVLNWKGETLPGFPVYLEDDEDFESVRATPAIADLDGDGRREIAVWSDLGKLWIIKDDGTVLPGWPKRLRMPGEKFSKATLKPSFPTIVDIDYDGRLEVLAPGWESDVAYLHALEANGEPVNGWPIILDNALVNMPTVDDIDADGALELILAVQGNVHCLHITRNESLIRPLLPWRTYQHDPFRTGNTHAWLPELSCAQLDWHGAWVGPDEFTFSVFYRDEDGDAPAIAELVLLAPDGVITTYQMEYSPQGFPGESTFSGRYAATVNLSLAGQYQHSFHFSDGYRFHYKRADQTDEVWFPGPSAGILGPYLPQQGPRILAAGLDPTRFSAAEGTILRIQCFVDHPSGPSAVEGVELLYESIPTGVLLNDDGLDGDQTPGDSIFTCSLSVPPNFASAGRGYLLSIAAWDKDNVKATDWPFLPGTYQVNYSAICTVKYETYELSDDTPRLRIRLGGASSQRPDPHRPAQLRFLAVIAHPDGPGAVENVSLLFEGMPTGLRLTDDGQGGDEVAGDSIFTLVIDSPLDDAWSGTIIEMIATDTDGNSSDLFPYLWVSD